MGLKDISGKAASARRKGDTVAIGGDYQHVAATKGNSIQRFWHYSKILAIDCLLPPQPGDTILDVGCGSGVISSFLGQKAARVTGIDANPEAVEFARKTYGADNISFQGGLADDLTGQDASFDKIYCLELIEHIYPDQTKAMLSHFARLLKPGGKVFLTTPNYHSPWPAIEWLMDRLKLSPQLADHQHVAKYTRRRLRELSQAAGFAVEVCRTTCFAAPWFAPVSWKGAEFLAKRELAGTLWPGSILVCILSHERTTV